MIIIDMNQISVASLMMHLHMNKGELEEDMVRHMILNSVRMYRTMFNEDYGEIVLAYDSRAYWRKEIFPQYKSNRRKNREQDDKDWDSIFGVLNNIKEEIKEFLPYKVVEVYGAEADDVIATLCKYCNKEKVMIVSGDKDFIQLHKYEDVNQYSPIQKKFVKDDDPKKYLHEQIIKGDRSDGIPNILSDDNVFVTGEKQQPIHKKRLQEWAELDNIPLGSITRLNYQRNKKLIDLDEIPIVIQENIINTYRSYQIPDSSKLLQYFIDHKLKNLMTNINDF